MDIAALSVNLNQAQLATKVGVSLLSINKDLMLQQGQAIEKLMASTSVQNIERSVSPHLGSTIDIKL